MTIVKKFYVVGDPIDHSKSPFIHLEFASQFRLAIDYQKKRICSGDLAEFLARAKTEDVVGINATVPLKGEAFHLADEPSDRAISAESANTLWFSEGKTFADNTDGIGIIKDIEQNIGFSLKDKKILIVGAGGAARGILGPILDRRPGSLTITNRTFEKSLRFAELDASRNITILEWGERLRKPLDLILNCTSLSLSDEIPLVDRNAIGPKTICYDLAYRLGGTSFVNWAVEMGAALAVDGIGMLVEQAAESFRTWHGYFPDTGPVIRRLRQNIK